MAYVTSIINLKGGVGKTTITLALAHFLALEHGNAYSSHSTSIRRQTRRSA